MALFEKFFWMAVIGDKEKASRIFWSDERKQILKVSCRCPLADHDPHPVFQFLFGFFESGTFMVRTNSCSEISVKPFSRKHRGMAINSLALCHLNFFENFRIPENDTREVHHLCQSDRPGFFQKWL